LEGRYGPYATDGKTNASLAKGTDPASVTLDQAVELLDARRKKPARRRVTRRKK
jgi:DNA topoisomerase-1